MAQVGMSLPKKRKEVTSRTGIHFLSLLCNARVYLPALAMGTALRHRLPLVSDFEKKLVMLEHGGLRFTTAANFQTRLSASKSTGHCWKSWDIHIYSSECSASL